MVDISGSLSIYMFIKTPEFYVVAKCLGMRHIILRGEGCLLSSMRYVYIYLFIGLSGFTVVNNSLQS